MSGAGLLSPASLDDVAALITSSATLTVIRYRRRTDIARDPAPLTHPAKPQIRPAATSSGAAQAGLSEPYHLGLLSVSRIC